MAWATVPGTRAWDTGLGHGPVRFGTATAVDQGGVSPGRRQWQFGLALATATRSWTAERLDERWRVEFCQLVLLQAPVPRSGRSRSGGRPVLGGCMDEFK